MRAQPAIEAGRNQPITGVYRENSLVEQSDRWLFHEDESTPGAEWLMIESQHSALIARVTATIVLEDTECKAK